MASRGNRLRSTVLGFVLFASSINLVGTGYVSYKNIQIQRDVSEFSQRLDTEETKHRAFLADQPVRNEVQQLLGEVGYIQKMLAAGGNNADLRGLSNDTLRNAQKAIKLGHEVNTNNRTNDEKRIMAERLAQLEEAVLNWYLQKREKLRLEEAIELVNKTHSLLQFIADLLRLVAENQPSKIKAHDSSRLATSRPASFPHLNYRSSGSR